MIEWWPFPLAAANIIEGKNGSVIILSSLILKFSTNLGDEGGEDRGRGDVSSDRSWPLVVEDNLVTGDFLLDTELGTDLETDPSPVQDLQQGQEGISLQTKL